MMPTALTSFWISFACKCALNNLNYSIAHLTYIHKPDIILKFCYRCPSGTDGKQCETAPERCVGSPCMHGGKCQDYGSGLNCTCPQDYRGIGCQYELDACEANVCANGATCVDEGPGYMCICPPGFTGIYAIK